MPFDWREFLIVAHGLRHDNREGVQRTCLGRTYYYVYNLGLTKARAINFTGQTPASIKSFGIGARSIQILQSSESASTGYACIHLGLTLTTMRHLFRTWRLRLGLNWPERKRLKAWLRRVTVRHHRRLCRPEGSGGPFTSGILRESHRSTAVQNRVPRRLNDLLIVMAIGRCRCDTFAIDLLNLPLTVRRAFHPEAAAEQVID